MNDFLNNIKQREEDVKRQEAYIRSLLPHLYPIEGNGYQWYKWQHDWINFCDPTKKYQFLLKPNQTGGSVSNIAKATKWATDKSLWTKLWRKTPSQFWYLYPSRGVATREFKTKWIKEVLPREEMKDDPAYGWKAFYKGKDVEYIEFNSGITLYFMSYEMDWKNLQTSSVDAIFPDEELPEEFWEELNARRRGTNGYIVMNATPTYCQEFWRRELEPKKGEKQKILPKAKHISHNIIYDCLVDIDGNPSVAWTEDRIEIEIASCSSYEEIQRRFFARFIKKQGGLKYHAFSRSKNIVKPYDIPADWLHYACLDYGSGGEEAHPGAVGFVAIKPDFTHAAMYDGWRGDGITTTAGDIVQKFVELSKINPPWVKYPRVFIQVFYDYGNRDLKTIAEGLDEPVTLSPAEKGHDRGERTLNSLFKNCMLDIFDTPELNKVADECEAIVKGSPKRKLLDDISDTLRYIVASVGEWNFSQLIPVDKKIITKIHIIDERQESIDKFLSGNIDSNIDQELEYWDNRYNEF